MCSVWDSSMVTQAAAIVAKPKLSQSEATARMRKLFDQTDVDGNGSLQLKEIKELCRKLGDRMSTTILDEAFVRMDPDRTGKVTISRPHITRIALYGIQVCDTPHTVL